MRAYRIASYAVHHEAMFNNAQDDADRYGHCDINGAGQFKATKYADLCYTYGP